MKRAAAGAITMVTFAAIFALGSGCSDASGDAATKPGVESGRDAASGCSPRAPAAALASASGFDDACFVEELAKGVTAGHVMCMGEPSHGIAESTSARLALVRAAMVRGESPIIAFEADDATMQSLDNYIETGSPLRAKLAFQRNSGTLFATEANRRLFDGLRALRVEVERPIPLRGIDASIAPASALELLRNALTGRDAALLARATRLPDAASSLEAFLAAANEASALRDALVAASAQSSEAADKASLDAAAALADALFRGYSFNGELFRSGFTAANAMHREPFMATRMQTLVREYPGRAVVVFAHNGHCLQAEAAQGAEQNGASPNAGSLARAALGERYQVLMMVGASGSELLPSGSTAALRVPPLPLALAKATSVDLALVPNHGSPYPGLDLDASWTSYQGSQFPSQVQPMTQWQELLFVRTMTPTRFSRSSDWP